MALTASSRRHTSAVNAYTRYMLEIKIEATLRPVHALPTVQSAFLSWIPM